LAFSSKRWPVEELCVDATPASLDTLHAALERFWHACDALPAPPQAGMWRFAFDTAVAEVGANIVRHAYAGRPTAGLRLRLRMSANSVVACFVDSGRSYRSVLPAALMIDASNLLDLPEGGMGLPIARAALDQFSYRRAGNTNIWLLVKQAPPAE
jgi:anti-sigma regulatory factor (Ser/Thr protein kinase)